LIGVGDHSNQISVSEMAQRLAETRVDSGWSPNPQLIWFCVYEMS